eukprot:1156558-Amphidinium_carterae.1
MVPVTYVLMLHVDIQQVRRDHSGETSDEYAYRSLLAVVIASLLFLYKVQCYCSPDPTDLKLFHVLLQCDKS